MKISMADWIRYRDKLSRISQKAADAVRDYIWKEHKGLDDVTVDEIVAYTKAVIDKYSDASSELACQMYDEAAEAQNAHVPAAEAAEPADIDEVNKAIHGVLKQSPDGNLIGDPAARLTKRAAADTMLKNAMRDNAEFAWIPGGGETCAFCLTLASRGWQQASDKTMKGGHAEHIHANCKCQFAVRFDGRSSVEGYEPEKLRKQYDDAEGDTWREKLRSMERAYYAENKDEINARKREIYQRKHEKSLNRQLQFTYNGNVSFIPNHTIIHNSHVIAGRDSETELRVAQTLADKYHNQPTDWNKLVGKVESERYVFDIHWYEDEQGTMHDPKIKHMKERKQ